MKKILIFVFSLIIFSGFFAVSFSKVANAADPKLYSVKITPNMVNLSTEDFLPNTEVIFALESASDSLHQPKTVFSNSIGTASVIFSGLISNTKYSVSAKSRDSNASFVFTTPDNLKKENGACGTAKDRYLSDKPTDNLCLSGIPSEVSLVLGKWSWLCAGMNDGVNSSTCLATKSEQKGVNSYYDFICNATVDSRSETVLIKIETNTKTDDWQIGVLDSKISTTTGTPNFKNVLEAKSGYFSATYNFDLLQRSINYRTLVYSKKANQFATEITSCNFTVPEMIHGACGPAKGQIFTSEPAKNLCDSGESLGVSKNYLEWRWICYGNHGGNDSPVCIAKVGFSGTGTTDQIVDTKGIDASSEEGGLVPKCPPNGCGFPELMKLVRKVINFVLFVIATPLAALVFVYAGITLLTSGGDSGKLTSAKKMLGNLLIGYVIALAAWLIINTILTSLGYDGTWFLTR